MGITYLGRRPRADGLILNEAVILSHSGSTALSMLRGGNTSSHFLRVI